MQLSYNIAQHVHQLFHGKNWTWSFVDEHLDDVSWQEATNTAFGNNTIAQLLYHIYYYMKAHVIYLDGGVLDYDDKFSFEAPIIANAADWVRLKTEVNQTVEKYCKLIQQLPDELYWKDFREDPKFGNYYHNIQGVIEHGHYHLGQIVLIKKLLRGKK